MRPIATFCFQPFLNNTGSKWASTEHFLACAKASIEMANVHLGRPTIYTDSLGKKILPLLSPKADYIVVYDDLHKEYPLCLWALSKIFTYQQQKEPYIHFDLDLLFLSKLSKELLDCDLLVQVKENILEKNEFIKLSYQLPKIGHLLNLPPMFQRDNINSVAPLNCGILFMNNMDLNKVYTDTALDLVNRNLEVIKSGVDIGMCVIEQHTLGLLIEDMPHIKCNTMLAHWNMSPYNKFFVHFGGSSSKETVRPIIDWAHRKFIVPWINEDIRKLAQVLDKIKNGLLPVDSIFSL
jgi:hypothetical protein